MESREGDIHPLDRDYSDDTPVKSRSPIGALIDYHAKLRWLGLIVFALGFLGLFPAAVLLHQAKGNLSAESFAASVQRLAMVVILVGGVMVVAAYHRPQIPRVPRFLSWGTRAIFSRPYLLLCQCNIAVFVFFVAAVSTFRWVSSPLISHLLMTGLITTSVGLLITMVVWHHGFLRAYAIGALTTLTWIAISGVSAMNSLFWGSDPYLILLAQPALVLLSGVACAGYVAALESIRS